ncbi:uncharacterized protein LOC129045780 isoform X3 [Mirounga angustirostris]|uniref:uncharacterized protein LOC129045780 isoform X3 n=1 Tax=Mirounga angustirostris TaxID=9716 RepID=UPI00313D73DE
MATYPPRRLLGARPLPSDPRRDPRRSGFTQGGGGRWERRLRTGQGWGPRNLRCLCTHFQGLAACHHHLLRKSYLREKDTIGPLSSLSKQRSSSSGAKGSSKRELELRGTQGNCICFVHLCVSAALPKKNKHQTFHLTRIPDLEDKNEEVSEMNNKSGRY